MGEHSFPLTLPISSFLLPPSLPPPSRQALQGLELEAWRQCLTHLGPTPPHPTVPSLPPTTTTTTFSYPPYFHIPCLHTTTYPPPAPSSHAFPFSHTHYTLKTSFPQIPTTFHHFTPCHAPSLCLLSKHHGIVVPAVSPLLPTTHCTCLCIPVYFSHLHLFSHLHFSGIGWDFLRTGTGWIGQDCLLCLPTHAFLKTSLVCLFLLDFCLPTCVPCLLPSPLLLPHYSATCSFSFCLLPPLHAHTCLPSYFWEVWDSCSHLHYHLPTILPNKPTNFLFATSTRIPFCVHSIFYIFTPLFIILPA